MKTGQHWHVYVMHSSAGYTKIGTAVDPAARLQVIQPGHPGLLRLVWTASGGSKIEHALHAQCEESRVYGEWFDFAGRDPIEAIAVAAEPLWPAELPSQHRPSDPAARLRQLVMSMRRRHSDVVAPISHRHDRGC